MTDASSQTSSLQVAMFARVGRRKQRTRAVPRGAIRTISNIREPPWQPPMQRVRQRWCVNIFRKLLNVHHPKAPWSKHSSSLAPKTWGRATFPMMTKDGGESTFETPSHLQQVKVFGWMTALFSQGQGTANHMHSTSHKTQAYSKPF